MNKATLIEKGIEILERDGWTQDMYHSTGSESAGHSDWQPSSKPCAHCAVGALVAAVAEFTERPAREGTLQAWIPRKEIDALIEFNDKLGVEKHNVIEYMRGMA